MNNTVVLLVVSRSRTVVTLNKFLFFNATYTIETLVVERKKITTPLYMDAGA